jgi:predicted nucleic acid-binding protein
MPIQLRVIDVPSSIKIAHRHKIYAYDAYMLQCEVECGFRLLTLDRGLTTAARAARVPLCEVPP